MTKLDSNTRSRIAKRLVTSSTILILATGLTSMAFAQDEGQGAAANMQGGEIGEYQHHLGYSIEGSWIFDIDVLGQGTPFHSLISFAAGRVVITSASLPGPASSPFYGSWRPTETNRVQAAFFAFVPDATGVGVALSKVSLNLKVTSRNALTGTAVGANCDLQGESCVQTAEFQFTGKRITPE